MLTFRKLDNKLILSYAPEFGGNRDWIMNELEREILVKRTFFFEGSFTSRRRATPSDPEMEDPDDEDLPNLGHKFL